MTARIPYWSVHLNKQEQSVVSNTALHIQSSGQDRHQGFSKAVSSIAGDVIHLTRGEMIEAEEAIDLWALEKDLPASLQRIAGQLCCRFQHISRCEPSGFNEVETPPAKPVERQISLFGTEQEGVRE